MYLAILKRVHCVQIEYDLFISTRTCRLVEWRAFENLLNNEVNTQEITSKQLNQIMKMLEHAHTHNFIKYKLKHVSRWVVAVLGIDKLLICITVAQNVGFCEIDNKNNIQINLVWFFKF